VVSVRSFQLAALSGAGVMFLPPVGGRTNGVAASSFWTRRRLPLAPKPIPFSTSGPPAAVVKSTLLAANSWGVMLLSSLQAAGAETPVPGAWIETPIWTGARSAGMITLGHISKVAEMVRNWGL
jgi:hypothetical protein